MPQKIKAGGILFLQKGYEVDQIWSCFKGDFKAMLEEKMRIFQMWCVHMFCIFICYFLGGVQWGNLVECWANQVPWESHHWVQKCWYICALTELNTVFLLLKSVYFNTIYYNNLMLKSTLNFCLVFCTCICFESVWLPRFVVVGSKAIEGNNLGALGGLGAKRRCFPRLSYPV